MDGVCTYVLRPPGRHSTSVSHMHKDQLRLLPRASASAGETTGIGARRGHNARDREIGELLHDRGHGEASRQGVGVAIVTRPQSVYDVSSATR